jgi:hypothetical protein
MPHQAIEKYAQEYAEVLCRDIFKTSRAITGAQLKTCTPIQQVNLFLIKTLLLEWKKESSRLKSPYFDFENPEVQEALAAFMNTLSRHISIERAAFQPLLVRAVQETLLLIFMPYNYYKNEISKHPALSATDMREVAKYLKVNDRIWKEIIGRMNEKNLEALSGEEALRMMDTVMGEISESPADVDGYLVEFSKTLPLDADKFYQNDAKAEAEVAAPVLRPTPMVEVTTSVHERYQEVKATLHDTLTGEAKPTLAEIHSKKKITSIKEHLSINQRYLFANELFKGDNASFFKAIETLDGFQSFTEAIDFIKANYTWDMNGEETQEFLEILSKRY